MSTNLISLTVTYRPVAASWKARSRVATFRSIAVAKSALGRYATQYLVGGFWRDLAGYIYSEMLNVRFWPKADIRSDAFDVRF